MLHLSPPAPGQHRTNGIRQYVGGISRGALNDGRANDLEQRGPPDEMAENLGRRGR